MGLNVRAALLGRIRHWSHEPFQDPAPNGADMATLDHGIRSDPSRSIDAELRDLDMPADEVDVVVAAEHPVIVHRYLELHRERLEERLADQLRTLERLERFLIPGDPRGIPSWRRSSLQGRRPTFARRVVDGETTMTVRDAEATSPAGAPG